MDKHYQVDDKGNFSVTLADGGVVVIDTNKAFGAEMLQAGTLEFNARNRGHIDIGTQLQCPGEPLVQNIRNVNALRLALGTMGEAEQAQFLTDLGNSLTRRTSEFDNTVAEAKKPKRVVVCNR